MPKSLQGRQITFEKNNPQPFPERYLYKLKDSKLISEDGFIIMGKNKALLEPAWIKENIYDNLEFNFTSKVLSKDHVYFSCLLFWSKYYFHWFCDVLMRFYNVQQYLPENTIYIVPSQLQDWKLKSLEAIGITPEQLYLYDGKATQVVPTLYYATPIGMTGDIDRESANWLAKKLKKGLKTQFNRRLYISRRKARCRHIVNEDDLLIELQKLSFEIVVAENFSFEEQRTIFSQAEIIIAPHGAGLTNMIFAREGIKVVEIFEPNSLRRCYWSLSNALGHNYYCFVADSVKNDSEYNIQLNVNNFVELIKDKVLSKEK